MVCTFHAAVHVAAFNETEGKMIRLFCGIVASLGLVMFVSAARAEDKAPTNDREFIAHMATGGHAEVKYAELAEKRAQNAKVKEYAARMAKDHTEVNKKLADVAKNQKVAVVAGLEGDKRAMFMDLSKLQGDEFDRHYMKMMVENHEKSVVLLDKFSKMGMDPEVKKFCEEILPTVKEHLTMAKEINETVNKQ